MYRKIDIMEDRQSRFQAEQIRKSIRTFRDYSGDLLRSDLSTFADRLQALMYFCRTDAVFSTIHQQLVNNPNVDGNEWLQKQGETARLSGLRFPVDSDQRISLMYQLLAAGEENPENVIGRLPLWYPLSTNSVSAYIRAFAEGVMTPLFRELNYRLEEIEEKLPAKQGEMVSAASLQIIHIAAADLRNQTFNVHHSHNFQIGDHNSQTALNLTIGEMIQRIDASNAGASEKAEAKRLIAKVLENPIVKSVVGTLTESAIRALTSSS